MARRLARIFGLLAIVLLLAPILLILLYRIVPPPLTPLMLVRQIEGEGLEKRWASFDEIAPALRRAVIASEDARFCQHHGFDWDAIEDAWDDYQSGERVRGGSTITQQTAKNLLLWPGRDWIRKVVETYPTMLLELLWPKQRILETYLNIAEWGPGLYGAEAGAQRYFGKPTKALSAREAALMAAVLPNPRRWSPAKPTAYIERRAATIQARMASAPEACR